VEVLDHESTPIPGYYGFLVRGRCGPIDDSKRVEVPTICPGGIFPHWIGLYFDPDTWDGSDIFLPGIYGAMIIVTEDVKLALERARIKNLAFIRLTEYSTMLAPALRAPAVQ
jgi:hypothetical protein